MKEPLKEWSNQHLLEKNCISYSTNGMTSPKEDACHIIQKS